MSRIFVRKDVTIVSASSGPVRCGWSVWLLALATLFPAIAGVGCRPMADRVEAVVRRQNQALMTLPVGRLSVLRHEEAPVEPAEVESLLPEDVLTIEDARRISVRSNPDLHAAQARLMVATAQIQQAISRFLPSVSFSHSDARTFQTPVSRNRLSSLLQLPTTPQGVIDTDDPATTVLLSVIRLPQLGASARAEPNTSPFSEHSTSITGAWVLFDGYIRNAQLLAAKSVQAASADSFRDARRLIIQAVDSAYYRVQLAEERLRIARADDVFSREQLDETLKLMAANRATESDVNNFRVRATAAQANVTAAVGQRDLGRVLLAELIGLPTGDLPPGLALSALTDETEAEMTLPDVEAWILRAKARRPDVRQFEALLETERQNVLAAKGLFLPSVSISGTWGYDRRSNWNYGKVDQSSAGALDVRWDLYVGGSRRASVRAAEAAVAEAQANLNRVKLAIHSDVRSAVIDIINAREQILLQRENLETSRENRRIIRAAYLAGRKPLTRLNESQRDFINADADLALARIRLRQAWTDLNAAAASGYGATVDEPSGHEPAQDASDN